MFYNLFKDEEEISSNGHMDLQMNDKNTMERESMKLENGMGIVKKHFTTLV